MKKVYYAVLHTGSIIQACFTEILTLMGIFVMPPLLIFMNIKFHIIPSWFPLNFVALGMCTLFCFNSLKKEGWDWKSDFNFKKIPVNYYLAYSAFTIVGIISLLVVKDYLNLKFDPKSLKNEHYLAVLPVCWAQVISYLEYLPRKLKLFAKSKFARIMLCALFFTFMHIMFKPEFIGICAVGGIAFAWIYEECRNSVLMTISHGILNIFTGFLGAFNG
jgi:hypothetical protein